MEDNSNEPPITLGTIEHSFDKQSVSSMLECEKGYRYNPSALDDVAVCNIIDKQLIKRFGKSSVYALSDAQKLKVAQVLRNDFHLPQHQISRCLVL